MSIRSSFILTLCLTVLTAFPAPAEAPATTAKDDAVATVEGLLADIRSYRAAPEGESLSEEDRSHNAALAEKIHGYLDIDGLARRSLMGTWDELSTDERAAFVALLRKLFAGVAYPKSAAFFAGLTSELVGTSEQGDKQLVSMEVSHPDEGLIEIDFHLTRVGDAWKIVELDLDGASLALDIRAQMQKIIRENSYADLKRRMLEKLEEEGVGT